jgi:hypothetical protein
MKLQIASGEAEVFVYHGYVDTPRRGEIHEVTVPRRDEAPYDKWSGAPDECRATVIMVRLPDGQSFGAQAICKPPDQYVKRIGRSLASRRLAAILKDHDVSRDDRAKIFEAVWRQPQ